MIPFSAQKISFVKRKSKLTIEQQKCKGHEKCDRLLISKMKIPSEINVFRIDPFFSKWVNFNKKSVHTKLFYKLKEL